MLRARARLPDIRIELIDGYPTVFGARSFGVVLLFSVLTCTPDDGARGMLVEEVSRLLAPGGIVYVADFLIAEDSRNRERYARSVRRGHLGALLRASTRDPG